VITDSIPDQQRHADTAQRASWPDVARITFRFRFVRFGRPVGARPVHRVRAAVGLVLPFIRMCLGGPDRTICRAEPDVGAGEYACAATVVETRDATCARRADRVAAAGGPSRSSTAGAVDTDETRWQRVISDEPAVLTYQKIDGEPVGVPVSLQRVDFNSFTLRNRGFDRVKDYPYLK
jgi:hypothetical protein